MIIDLERIGDNAEDVAHIAEKLSGKKQIKEYVSIPKMATETINNVKLSLRAYINDDVSEINNMEKKDDIIDDFFIAVKEEISEIVLKDPESIDTALDILMVAKYLEKISDHAVNIADHVKEL